MYVCLGNVTIVKTPQSITRTIYSIYVSTILAIYSISRIYIIKHALKNFIYSFMCFHKNSLQIAYTYLDQMR